MSSKRLRIRCCGAVQGVGFRPTAHRLARQLDLAGRVWNDADGATVEVEGEAAAVDAFAERLLTELPPLARLDGVTRSVIASTGESGFAVIPSTAGRRGGALVPADAALCSDCRREMDDPTDRRHRYPFTTCTNCGPRYSLVYRLPYDREVTSMACFALCDRCRSEYEDPDDRRYHAEPLCCPSCGPQLWLSRADGVTLACGDEALRAATQALLDGAIVAVKGLGGFQIACRADDDEVVRELRKRKDRPRKPFAVMLRSATEACTLAYLEAGDEALLASPQSPVILARKRSPSPLSPLVAPGLGDLGLMLPTTPLHVELLRDPRLPPLVMTSGNRSDEPITRGNREALLRLATIADLFLLHDRDVVRRVDDSVLRSTAGGAVMVRRSRGFVPVPEELPAATPRPIISVGGHLQATGCVAVGGTAFMTQHVGDLDTESARAFLEEALYGLEDFLQVEAEIVVCDAHPDYPSSWFAARLAASRGARLLPVQHHLAHAAAVLAEHRRFPAPGELSVALCLDGTGWGPDFSAWGGEWLALDGDLRWRRLAHLQALPLVGGERAIAEPWRVAVAALVAAGAEELISSTPLAASLDRELVASVCRLAASPGWPRASGAGRLFEAAGALLGLASHNRFEGEAAALLESLAEDCSEVIDWPEVALDQRHGPVLPSARLLAAAAVRLRRGETPVRVAAGFHTTFCRLAAELLREVLPAGAASVVAGGGCLVNRRLRRELCRAAADDGMEILLPWRMPPGDGGLAFGQATLAAVSAARGVEPQQLECDGSAIID